MKNTREVKTNKKGEWVQIGLFPGEYSDHRGEGRRHDGHHRHAGLDRREPGDHDPKIGSGGTVSGSWPRKRPRCRSRLTKASPLSKAGDFDGSIAKFNEAIAQAPNCARLLLQHRLRPHAEEGVGQGGGRLQEGDRDQAGLRRGVERAGQRLQLAEEARSGARGQRERGQVRRLGGRRAAAAPARCTTRASSSGTRASTPRRRRSSRRRSKADPELRRRALPAGDGEPEPRRHARRVAAFEGYLKAAPTGAHAEQVKGVPEGPQEVAGTAGVSCPTSPPISPPCAAASSRRPARRAAIPPISVSSPSRRRSRPTLSARRLPPDRWTSARTACRKPYRKSAKRPNFTVGGILSVICRRTRRERSSDRSPMSTRRQSRAAADGSTRRRPRRADVARNC